MVNSNNFITIQGWMVNDLKLSGTDLLIYAVIYGFSQDGESVFSGSIQYLQEWTGAGRNTVKRSLQKLCEKGVITKTERSGKINFYKANCNISNPAQNDPAQNGLTDQNEHDPAQNGTGTQPKMTPDNIDNNIYINNNIYTRAREKKAKPQKHKYGEYKKVLLSDEELDKLKQEFPHDWEIRIQTLDDYIATHKKGEGYKNHLAVIRTWARRDNNTRGAGNKSPKLQSEPFNRPEYDDTAFDRILEQIGDIDRQGAET